MEKGKEKDNQKKKKSFAKQVFSLFFFFTLTGVTLFLTLQSKLDGTALT
jgi:hypothetical protein